MNVLETVEECNSIAPPESREAVLSGTEYTSFHSLHEGADETRECGEEEDGQPSLPPTSASHYAIGFGEITPENMDGFGADGQENVVIEEWKRKAMECGIEFVESGDKYYEGFRRSELEDDEEELKIRGGVGYRPFVPGTTPREEDYADPDDIENDGYDPVFCCDGKMQIGKGNEVSRIGCDSKTFSGKGCLANSFGEHHKLSASRSPSTSDNRRVVGASSAHVSVAVNDGSTTGDEGSSAEVPNRSDFTNCTHTSAEEKRRFERRETSMDSTCTVPPSTHTSQSGAATTFPNNEKDSDEGDCDHHQNGREHLTYQQQQGTVSSTKTRVFDGKQGKWDGGDDLQFSSSMEDSSIGDPEGEEVAGEQEQEFGHENQTQRPVKGGEDDDDDDDQDSLRGSLARLPGGAGDNYGGFETESWSSLMSSGELYTFTQQNCRDLRCKMSCSLCGYMGAYDVFKLGLFLNIMEFQFNLCLIWQCSTSVDPCPYFRFSSSNAVWTTLPVEQRVRVSLVQHHRGRQSEPISTVQWPQFWYQSKSGGSSVNSQGQKL